MLISRSDKIYVAGHSGMLGRSLINTLSSRGYSNIITTSRKEDLTSSDIVDNLFSIHKPSVVINAAAKVGGIQANIDKPYDFLSENLQIQNNIISCSLKYGIKRLLLVGSSCIYPKYSIQPIVEESLLSGPLEPTLQYYAIAKIAGIKAIEALRDQYSFDAISLMPSNLYGPGDNYDETNSHVLPSFIRRFHQARISSSPSLSCWGSGNVLREFLYVDDLALACLFALEHWDPSDPLSPKDTNNRPLSYLNVGTGIDITIRDLAMYVSNVVGYRGPITWDTSKPEGVPRKLLDVSRLKSLGWSPQYDLSAGLLHTYSDFCQQLSSHSLREK